MPAPQNGPPKDVPPNELWARLSELPRPSSDRVKFVVRGEEAETVFWVLTAGELSSARSRADKTTRGALEGNEKVAGAFAYEQEFEVNQACELLALAARQPDDVRFPYFPRPVDVRQTLTDDEITQLVVAYNVFRRESAPVISEMTKAEMEAWIAVLQEGASRLPLARLSGEGLSDLVMYLVSRVPRTSSTGTSSAGSPPDGPSTPTETDSAP